MKPARARLPARRPNPLRSPSVAAAALALAALASVSAQPAPDEPTRLPAYWVQADTDSPGDFAPHPFTLTREARANRATTTLMDSLADAPGMLLQESFGGFEPPRLSLRGSGLQSAPSSRGVAFLLDGFPLGLADGSFNSALVAPVLVDRIELFRGAAAATVAPAVLGGALNLRTGSDPSATLRAAAGSFGAQQASLAGRTPGDFLAFDAALALDRQDGFRAHSAQHRTALFAALHRPLPTGSDSSVSVYHVRASYDVPGPLTRAAAELAPRSTSADVQRDQPHRQSELTQLTAQTAQQNSVLALDAGLSWLHTTDHFRQLQANGLTQSRSDDLTARAALTRRFDASTGDLLLRSGLVLSRGWRDLQRFNNDAGATGARFDHDGLFATTASVDLGATAPLPAHLALTAGVAALAVRRDLADRLPPGVANASTTQPLHSTALLPRARLTWAARPGVALHAGVAQATEPPTFDDLLFVTGAYPRLTRRSQPLANQRATTWELGTTGTRGPFGWDLTAYTANWHNEILRLADAQGLPRGAVNASATQHRGVEATANWRLVDRGPRLSLLATATWNRFTFVDDPVYADHRLAGAPPHQGSATLLHEYPNGFFAAPALEWRAGATPVDHAGRMTYGGCTLASLRLGWRSARAWSVFAEIKNLFDRRSVASTAGVLDLARNPATTAVFLPGVSRTLTFGLECPLP